MSKEHQTDPQAQQATEAPTTEVQDQTYGLRPDLYAQLMQMGPGDAEAVAAMLASFPSMMGKILAVAAHHIGNAAVQRAIAIRKKSMATVSGAQGTVGQDEVHALLQDEADAPGKIGSKETLSLLSDPEEQAKAPVAEPAWVAGARAYNTLHAGLASEFNDLTNGMCTGDEDNKLDPQAVARWQANHGVEPDGRVGPHTVATARHAKSKGPELAAATPADARPPV